MIKNKILNNLIIIICFILFLCGCTSKQKADFDYTNKEQVKKEILTNFEEIANVTDMKLSNPYDYTKNEYYKNIVNLGNSAVLVLEEMYYNKELSGVNAYLSALAIQDITGCNLYERYNLDWSTADDFYTLWKDNNCSFKEVNQ